VTTEGGDGCSELDKEAIDAVNIMWRKEEGREKPRGSVSNITIALLLSGKVLKEGLFVRGGRGRFTNRNKLILARGRPNHIV